MCAELLVEVATNMFKGASQCNKLLQNELACERTDKFHNTCLISLVHPLRHIPHIIVNFSRRRSQNKIANRIPRPSDVGITPQQVYPRIGNHNSRPRSILNRKTRFTILTGDTTNRTGQMIPPQYFHIRHLERLYVQIVQSKQRHGILRLESQHERPHKIRPLLKRRRVRRVPRRLHLDRSRAGVESDLKFEVFHQWGEELFPIFAEGGVPMGRAADAAIFGFAAYA
mmetsp:Transcript_4924/g.10875  ORF Transcript_4924/g.10875 Transcript_4924/m.10875 type:complete len:227 (+) Transcript_4924:65-745(+)